MRVVFMGTPEFSVPTLAAIIEAGHEVAAVYSQPPRPAGRGKKDRLSPVHQFAESHGLTVLTPKSLKKEPAQQTFGEHDADVAVVVAYGLILPQPILDAPKRGCLNLHGSLLPRWRGAAPIQRAVMAGDERSGIEVMRMEAGLDTGPVCLSAAVTLTPDITAGELHDILMEKGAILMVEALEKLATDSLDCHPQPEQGITYAEKIDKAEAHIVWSEPAHQVHNRIRGLSPFPGAWFEVEIGGKRERIKVLHSKVENASGKPGTTLDDCLLIACGSNAIRLTVLQRAGKRPMQTEELLRGFAIPAGTELF